MAGSTIDRARAVTTPDGVEPLHHSGPWGTASGAQTLRNPKLPALDPALVLVILRVALGVFFLSTFFENLGKGLYGAEGYAGLIHSYIKIRPRADSLEAGDGIYRRARRDSGSSAGGS